MTNTHKKLVDGDDQGAGALLSRRPIGAREGTEHRPAAHTVSVIDAQRSAIAPRQCAVDFAALESDFRGHHATSAARHSGPYEHYRLIYRYGYDLGIDPRYRTAAWSEVARAARPRWEERNPGTWAAFQATIRYAWEQARQLAQSLR